MILLLIIGFTIFLLCYVQIDIEDAEKDRIKKHVSGK